MSPAVDQRLLGVVGDDVGRGLAGIDVQAGDAPGVVVVEHQPGALLVGVVVGLRAVARIVRGAGHAQVVLPAQLAIVSPLRVEPHIGHVGHADALVLPGRGIGVRPLAAGVIHWCGVPSLIQGEMPPCRCRVARFSVKQPTGFRLVAGSIWPHMGSLAGRVLDHAAQRQAPCPSP